MAIETAINITNIQTAISQLSSEELIATVKPLVVFALSIVIYSIFVFKFYKFISKRDMFELKLYESRAKFARIIFYILEHLIIFPVSVFLWFVVISLILSIISEIHAITNIFMASMAIVTAIRITAYYNEELSRDLAKLLPLAFLGVIVVDYTFISIPVILDTIYQIPGMWKVLVYYLTLVLILEVILRIFTAIKVLFRSSSATRED